MRIARGQSWTEEAEAIGNDADFNAKVLKAMAQLSDNGAIPEHVTYENVLRIAGKLRASVKK